MKVKYDLEADALYIEIKDTTVTTKRLDQDIAVLLNPQSPSVSFLLR